MPCQEGPSFVWLSGVQDTEQNRVWLKQAGSVLLSYMFGATTAQSPHYYSVMSFPCWDHSCKRLQLATDRYKGEDCEVVGTSKNRGQTLALSHNGG